MTRPTISQTQSLKRRIQRFYTLLNKRAFDQCYTMIDPKIRESSTSVTLFQYQVALATFMEHFGTVDVQHTAVDLHLDEPSKLYENRDFATGETTWQDQVDEVHCFRECWVRHGRAWFTRSTGYVTPGIKQLAQGFVRGMPGQQPG